MQNYRDKAATTDDERDEAETTGDVGDGEACNEDGEAFMLWSEVGRAKS